MWPSSHAAYLAAFHPLNAPHTFQQGMNLSSRLFHNGEI
jgi:hypothetical protein